MFLSPITPAATGNGLAMRINAFTKAASADFLVSTLVVPVAGRSPAPEAGTISVLPLPGSREIAAGLPALMASPQWRQRIGAAYPLPALATLAPATLAAAAERLLGPAPGTPVHVARSYLAPLGIALAERIGSDWVTLDLDDDDEQLERSAGNEDAAASYGRLVAVFGPLFRRVSLAAPAEAAAVAARHGLAAVVVPNAVADDRAPEAAARAPGPVPGLSILFVGNLTYWPNADAARRLAREVLPAVGPLTAGPARVVIAGETGNDPVVRDLAGVPGVTMTGFVPDLGPLYAAADVLVAPLAFGAGTRIKLLEAFSRGVPVVTTSIGAAGLDAVPGRHLLIADAPGEMARAVRRLAGDAGLRERLAGAALDLVRTRYSHAAVDPLIRAFFAGAAADAAAERAPAGGGGRNEAVRSQS